MLLLVKKLKALGKILICSFLLAACDTPNHNKAQHNGSFKQSDEPIEEIAWESLSENQKVIGCWTAEPKPSRGSGNPRTIKSKLNYQMRFYASMNAEEHTFGSVGFVNTTPIIHRYENFNIENGVITYTFKGEVRSQRITIKKHEIIFNNRTYKKSRC